MSEREVETMHIELDDGTELVCAVLTQFTIDQNQYILLLPQSHNSQYPDDEVLIYRLTESESGDPILHLIESDDEYEKVADRYEEFLDELEYDDTQDHASDSDIN